MALSVNVLCDFKFLVRTLVRGWWYTVGEWVNECPMEYRKKESEVTAWQERACEMNCGRVTF